MFYYASTDKGKLRDTNQDAFYIPDSDKLPQLFIVADGMGGYNGGEIASNIAIKAVRDFINSNFSVEDIDKERAEKLIKNAIEYADRLVHEKAKEDENLSEMGTTLDIAVIYNNKVTIGHVGDSRIYRLRNAILRRITTDHSYVEGLVKDGTITKEEAVHHSKKNMITKAVGCMPDLEPDIFTKLFNREDILLMCSDGLTNMVDENTIYDIIKQNKENSAQKLVDKANENGGLDNITAVVIVK